VNTGPSSGTAGFVVVGAALAGIRAVESARAAGYEGPITLIGAEAHLPYDRPPLSKAFLTAPDADAVFYRDADALRQLEVDLRLGSPAERLDPQRRTVLAGGRDIPYDRLLIATGAEPRRLGHLPRMAGVLTLRTLDDARALRTAIRPAMRLVIVGAGFIGSELASSARALGAEVVIVDAAAIPLVRAVGDVVGQALAGLHRRHGTRLICGTRVEALLGGDRVTGVRLGTGETFAADLVLVGVGATPATGWLTGSGIALHPADGGVLCDEHLATSLPGVYAAGDVTRWPNRLLEETMRLENWTNAAEQAAIAAVNALFPERARPYETVPYFWSDWYGRRIQFVGSPAAEDVEFVSGGPDEDRFVALYRRGDRLIGAATLDEPRKIMKYRRFIASRGLWDRAADVLAGSLPR
jgi:NADPH-dependent 2,4-dienoyl-CoA reductase/sulfur reductase-like enzyme